VHLIKIEEGLVNQIIHSDLADLVPKSLHSELENANKYMVQNTLFQIMQITEVGVSCQSVLDSLGGKAKLPRNMLKFVLYDGKQTLLGMEHKPIPSLSLETPLGAKVYTTYSGNDW
jgi:RecQ mediated genome instability protein